MSEGKLKYDIEDLRGDIVSVGVIDELEAKLKLPDLSEYRTEEIQEELSRREGLAKECFIKSVHALYDFGFTYEAVRGFLDEI